LNALLFGVVLAGFLHHLPLEGALVEFVNGLFLGDLWENIEKKGIKLQDVLNDIAVLAIRLGHSESKSTGLNDTEPETIFLGKQCSYAEPDVMVFPIVRTGRNHFPRSITFGRALISDLCVASSQVSKFHGWFSRDLRSGDWVVTDNYSTNGTRLNGTRLKPGVANCLRPNDELQIGNIKGVFLDCMHLEALLSLFGSVHVNSE